MMIKRWTKHILTIIQREISKPKTHNPIYCIKIIEKMDFILDTHLTCYTWKAFYIFNAFRQVYITYTYAYTYTYTYAYAYTYTYTYTHTHARTHIYTYIYTQICIYINIYISTNASLLVYEGPSVATIVSEVKYGIAPVNSSKVPKIMSCWFYGHYLKATDIHY